MKIQVLAVIALILYLGYAQGAAVEATVEGPVEFDVNAVCQEKYKDVKGVTGKTFGGSCLYMCFAKKPPIPVEMPLDKKPVEQPEGTACDKYFGSNKGTCKNGKCE